MYQIVLNDGSKYDCYFCVSSEESGVFITIQNLDFPNSAMIFSNPNLTSIIETPAKKLIGYTNLIFIRNSPNGILIHLEGGHDEPKQLGSVETGIADIE